MAARRGTSRDQRAAVCGLVPALARAFVGSLLACQPPEAEPHRNLPGSSSTDASTDPATATMAATIDSGTGPEVLDTGTHHGGYPAPDCATLLLPGPSSDVAATPRPDHDAEVLALSLDPTRVAAPQAHYDVITADLAAIRALDPSVADVHVGCVVANGLAFWFFDDLDVNDALFAGDYHAWDCHHAYFHHRQEQRVDGVAVAIELDGVFGEAMALAYGSLPGLDDHEPWWFPREDWPGPAAQGSDCEPVSGAITLTATLLPEGTLDLRDYRFDRTDGSTVTWRVGATGPPELLR
jgi:hypothetical protein